MGPPGTGPPIRGDPDMYVDCPGGGGQGKVKTLAFHLKKIASQALGGRIFVSRLAAGLFFLLAASPLNAAPSDSVDITININVSSAPANIVDLAASQGLSPGTINLSWTEPGDNGLWGTASYYTIKVSTITNISDDLEFNAARPLSDFSPTPLFAPGPGGSIRSEVVTGLTVGDTYYFAIRATDNEATPNTNSWNRTSGNNSSNFAVAPGPPANITDLVALPGSQEGTIQLTWTQPGDDAYTGTASSYTVKLSTIANINDEADFVAARPVTDFSMSPIPVPGMSHTQGSLVLTGLQPGITYYVAIRASDDDMPSRTNIWSRAGAFNPNNFAAAADLAPSIPTGLAASIGQGQITLNWNANPENDLDFYRVYRDLTTPEDTYAFYASVTGTTFTDTEISVGNTYYYRITAVDRGPNILESAPSSSVSVLYLGAPQTAPTNFVAAALSPGSLLWSWQDNSTNEDGYRIKAGSGGFVSVNMADNTTSYLETGLSPNTPYTRFVEVFKDLTISSSTAVTRYTMANPPTNLLLSTSTENRATLVWNTNNNPAGTPYFMERAINNDDYVALATNVVVNSFDDYGIVEGSTYTYRVYARNGNGILTLPSNTVSIFIKPKDTIPPIVTGYSPSSPFLNTEAANVSPDASITVTFSETMQKNSLTKAFSLRAIQNRLGIKINETVEGSLTDDGLTLIIRPDEPLKKNYTYEMLLSTEATDLAGNRLTQPFQARFRIIFDSKVDNVFYGTDGKTWVRLPAGAIPQDGYIQMSLNPLQTPLGALSSAIKEANDKDKIRHGEQFSPLLNTIKEFRLLSLTGEDMGQSLQRPAELCLPYEDEDDDGFVTSNNYPIHERFLAIVNLNEEAKLWVLIPGSSVDTNNKTLTVRVPHFSVYAIKPVATNFVGDAYAYPVPFVPSQGHQKISFTNLAMETTILIYTISGELVQELHESNGDGQLDWDVSNSKGENVFSGVYIYVIKSGSEKKTGKLVIIR